jgi:hypothetical protein
MLDIAKRRNQNERSRSAKTSSNRQFAWCRNRLEIEASDSSLAVSSLPFTVRFASIVIVLVGGPPV